MTVLSNLVAAVIGIGACAVVALETDGRANRHENTNVRTLHKDYFQIMYSSATDYAFCRAFRMSRRCFEDLRQYLESVLPKYFKKPATPRRLNNKYPFAMKLAMVLSYLGSMGTMTEISDKYGVSIATLSRAVTSICRVLYYERSLHVFFPRNADEWNCVQSGFACIAGFPNVAGVVDGTLIQKTRPRNFWGWYCRKGFVAYNMQGIADSNMFFMDFSVPPGGCNDMTLWSRSVPGLDPTSILPNEWHFLGDGGYFLRTFMLIPNTHDNAQGNKKRRQFNLAHSQTRNPIERTFGFLKGRFPILKTELDMNSVAEDGILISACVVLHNWCLRHETDALSYLELEGDLCLDSNMTEAQCTDPMLSHSDDDPKFYTGVDNNKDLLERGVEKRKRYTYSLDEYKCSVERS
ncbi:hypothetical protein LEN26_001397 [Aphanomyces euteiches]|nr:hypothetical protein LEN26_001397 [Aphanomyces euteiches]